MSVNNNLQTGSDRIRVARFTASGSWVAPAGVFTVRVLAVGGGGGGGSARSASAGYMSHGGGGGGGGVFDELLEVVPGTSYTVTIGTGGAGATATGAVGANGTNTTLGSIMTAPGGQGGASMNAGTAAVPTSNPGGSMGGWSSFGDGTNAPGPGHGAGSPILATFSTSSGHSLVGFQVPNGDGLVTIPGISNNSGIGSVTADINYPATSATTAYYRIRRNESQLGAIPYRTQFLPGVAWKRLGAGGGAALYNTILDYYSFPNANFIDPSAGKVIPPKNVTFSPTSNAQAFNGTNAVANSGAGGGGSSSLSTSSATATGGNGGSGYMEIVWQE